MTYQSKSSKHNKELESIFLKKIPKNHLHSNLVCVAIFNQDEIQSVQTCIWKSDEKNFKDK